MENGLFPHLTEQQIEMLSAIGKVRPIKKDEYIIRVGDKGHSFYVVLKGSVGIYDETNQTEITIHRAGEFTGNSDSLSERAAVFNAIAHEDSEVLEISHEQLKELISKTQDLSDLLLRTFLLRRIHEVETKLGAVKLVGSRYSSDTYRIREFLSKNHVQYIWIDLEKDPASGLILKQFNIDIKDTPIVIASGNHIFKNPALEEIADVLGISCLPAEEVFDLIVVGAGPAGLAASVYASSEGLNVIAIDGIGPGGQAGSSSRIENYLGFPNGISGSELANQAYIQAQKFGCSISIPHVAKSLHYKDNAFHLELESGQVLRGNSVIAATGAHYRQLPISNLKMFEGRGVYYGATNMEAQTVSDKEIIIVGGGNSAGQAAIFLSEKSSKVHLVIRGDDLTKSMSSYLINRILNNQKIELHANTEIVELNGENSLKQVVMRNILTGERTGYNVSDLFLFLGAVPCSNWVKDITCCDEKGFVYTGRDIPLKGLKEYKWPLSRDPQTLETCVPGLFAVGDVRSGSVKRVASAVGEGSMAVSQVHAFLHS